MAEKIRTGIISFSDGRERVHRDLSPYIKQCQEGLIKALEGTGEVAVVPAREIVWNAELARSEARFLASQDPNAVIFNVPVFAFPNFSVIAAGILKLPCLVTARRNPSLPGLGGVQAAVNMIRQVGMECRKAWANIEEPETLRKFLSFLRAAYAATTLQGQSYGLIGGRSIGMGSGAVNPDLWMNRFGVDVEHVDELEILRRAESVPAEKVGKALGWLEKHLGSINYNGDKLTPESLQQQIRCYYATREIVASRKLDFVAVKCHYELSEYYTAQCLAAAFFNDPYDWDGLKEPVVYSCEADSDGALTMQILKLISGKPVLFMDFRYYDRERNLLTLCNCGAMATWYARRSEDPAENLAQVHLHPLIPKYAGKGCHVQYIAREGAMTLCRLTRVLDRYRLTIFRGECVTQPEEKLKESSPAWPHCFVKLAVPFERIIDNYDNNHAHGVSGDYAEELREFCSLKGIECLVIA